MENNERKGLDCNNKKLGGHISIKNLSKDQICIVVINHSGETIVQLTKKIRHVRSDNIKKSVMIVTKIGCNSCLLF